MSRIQDLVNRFEGLAQQTRRKFILGGHGGWRPADGMVKVPPGTTISFYVPHGVALSNPPSFDVDRGEFNERGLIVTRQGSAVGELAPTQTFKAGAELHNYTLFYRTRLTVPVARQREAEGGVVKGMKGFDIRFGNSETDKRFVTGNNLTLAVIFAEEKFIGADLHWSACRVEM
jgi:hypothetical protein